MKTKLQYFQDGFDAAFVQCRVLFIKPTEWRKEAYKTGYLSGVVHLEGEALRHGFTLAERREMKIKRVVDKASV